MTRYCARVLIAASRLNQITVKNLKWCQNGLDLIYIVERTASFAWEHGGELWKDDIRRLTLNRQPQNFLCRKGVFGVVCRWDIVSTLCKACSLGSRIPG